MSRSFGGTRRSDLATAIVDISSVLEYAYYNGPGSFGYAYPVGRRPLVRVRDPFTGTSMALSLWTKGTKTSLPPPQLLALAWAIESGQRPEPHQKRARQVADGFRQLAAQAAEGSRCGARNTPREERAGAAHPSEVS